LIINSYGRSDTLRLEGPRHKERQKRLPSPVKKIAATRDKLEMEILDFVGQNTEPVHQISITRRLLGFPANPKKSKYLKLLLGELAGSGVLIVHRDQHALRYYLGNRAP